MTHFLFYRARMPSTQSVVPFRTPSSSFSSRLDGDHRSYDPVESDARLLGLTNLQAIGSAQFHGRGFQKFAATLSIDSH